MPITIIWKLSVNIDEGASMGIDVSLGLKLLSNVLPQYNSKVYDLDGIS